MSSEHHNDSGAWWVARQENANKVWYALVGLCVVLIAADFVLHNYFLPGKHGYFDFETAIGFHAIYGFVAFLFAVLTGKELRKFLMRPEDYYDEPYVPVEHDDHHDHGHGHDQGTEEGHHD